MSTLAGSTKGYQEGVGTEARFDFPNDVAVDDCGYAYVTDSGNHRIRKITPQGQVSTLAGSTQGYQDGPGTEARLYLPVSVVLDKGGNVYFSDPMNQRIRKISPAQMDVAVSGKSTYDAAAKKAVVTATLTVTADGKPVTLDGQDFAGVSWKLVDAANEATVLKEGSFSDKATVTFDFPLPTPPTTPLKGKFIVNAPPRGTDATRTSNEFVIAGQQAKLSKIDVSPGTATVNAGNTQQLGVQATYDDGSTAPVTDDVTWTTGNPTAASVSLEGLVKAIQGGSSQIKAGLTVDGVTYEATATINILNADGSTPSSGGGGGGTAAPAPLAIGGVAPPNGAAGTVITITGTSFQNGATVTVGGTAATGVTFVDATSITATVPSLTLGLKNVTVTNPGPTAVTANNAFEVTAGAAPTFASVNPNNQPVGTPITINGTNFRDGATVTLGGAAATVTGNTGIAISTTVPNGLGATAHDIVITNLDGTTVTETGGYTVTAGGGGGAPTITGVTPMWTSAPPTFWTVTGTNFVNGATVTVNGIDVGGTWVDANTIAGTYAGGIAGLNPGVPYDVVVTNPDTSTVTEAGAVTITL